MKLDHALQSAHMAGACDHGDLVASILALIDCLETSDPTDDGERDLRQAAARRGLAAAIGAEREIAGLGRRLLMLESQAMTDSLTGLLNRRGFERELARTLALARRHTETGLLVFLDLDRFKNVNDSYGHAAGDEVLRRVGRVLASAVRKTDVVARLGGDEFAIILNRSDSDGGLRRARSIERLVNATVVDWKGEQIVVRGSIGTHPFGPRDDAAAVLARADDAMYRRKRSRDQAMVRLRVV